MPGSVEAEGHVLAAIMFDNTCLNQAETLKPEHFLIDSHRRIYSAMLEMAQDGTPIDLLSLKDHLEARQQLASIGGLAYLVEMDKTYGVPRANIAWHVGKIQEKAIRRGLIHVVEAIKERAFDLTMPLPDVLASADSDLQSISDLQVHDSKRITSMRQIPDPLSLPIEPVDWLVDGLMVMNSVTVMAAVPGAGKSSLALAITKSAILGTDFIGRAVKQLPVLYLDRENPKSLVQDRLARMFGAQSLVPYWGLWLDDPPPLLNDPRLLRIAKEDKPLIVVDSLIRFHESDENDTTEMSKQLGHLRALQAAGATVLVLHHSGKAEGNWSRGSIDIPAGVDMGWSLLQRDDLLELTSKKNRFGAPAMITIRPDWERGEFHAVDSPAITEKRDRLATVREIIATTPGLTQNKIVQQSGIGRTDCFRILRQFDGQYWRSETGERGSKKYFPMTGTPVPYQSGTSTRTGTPVLHPKGVPVVPVSTAQTTQAEVWHE